MTGWIRGFAAQIQNPVRLSPVDGVVKAIHIVGHLALTFARQPLLSRSVAILFALLILTGTGRAQLLPTSFIEKRVTFTLPSGWTIKAKQDVKTRGRVHLLIPYAAADGQQFRASVVLAATIESRGMTVKELGDAVVPGAGPTARVLADQIDGANWRTIVWTAVDKGVPYLFLDRFGAVNELTVELLIGFPLLANGDRAWIIKTVGEFNSLCKVFKIDGTNSFTTRVSLDQLGDLGIKP
jgi:hypothetical protein